MLIPSPYTQSHTIIITFAHFCRGVLKSCGFFVLKILFHFFCQRNSKPLHRILITFYLCTLGTKYVDIIFYQEILVLLLFSEFWPFRIYNFIVVRQKYRCALNAYRAIMIRNAKHCQVMGAWGTFFHW